MLARFSLEVVDEPTHLFRRDGGAESTAPTGRAGTRIVLWQENPVMIGFRMSKQQFQPKGAWGGDGDESDTRSVRGDRTDLP